MTKTDTGYEANGYFVVKGLFGPGELDGLHAALLAFHEAWTADNLEFYRNRAVNSAYITGRKYLDETRRRLVFQFLGSRRIMNVVRQVIPAAPAFMNTQLFFNPFNPEQRNYWHRDIQYTDIPVDEQRRTFDASKIIHLRIPMVEEPGVELVPGSHRNWDSDEEFAVRTSATGRKPHDDLPRGRIITPRPGDLLVFSANMIHRGIYGLDRFSFDALFCDSLPELTAYAEPDCLPGDEDLRCMEDAEAFINTIRIKNGKLPSAQAQLHGVPRTHGRGQQPVARSRLEENMK